MPLYGPVVTLTTLKKIMFSSTMVKVRVLFGLWGGRIVLNFAQ